jgi:hypothetical protein
MSNPDRTKQALERMRQRRTGGGRGEASEGDSDPNTSRKDPADDEGVDPLTSPSKDAASRRREAREKRQKARAEKAAKDGGNSEVDEDEGLNAGGQDKGDFLEEALLQVDRPAEAYPLQFFSRDDDTERKMQPALVIPDSLGSSFNISNPGAFCQSRQGIPGGTELLQHYDEKKVPREWTFDGRFDRDENSRDKTKDIGEREQLLAAGIDSGATDAEDLHYEKHCGLYDGAELITTPSALAMYLNGEDVPMPSSGAPRGPQGRVSRITQRLLRDLEQLTSDYKVMQTLSKPMEGGPRAPAGQAGPAGVISLLRDSEIGSIVKVVGDPSTGILENISVPDVTEAVGGRIGNWSVDADSDETLGPCPLLDGVDQRGSLKSLRVAVDQLLLKDHPLFLEEERLTCKLRQLHSQYSLLFEHRATSYLSYRLFAAIKELKRLHSVITSPDDDDADEFEDFHSTLLCAYDEIIQVLPALNDIRQAIDGTSVHVYSIWKDIKLLRLKQGFTSTRVRLYARKVAVPTGASGGKADGMADLAAAPQQGEDAATIRLDDDVNLWQALSGELGGVPALLEKVRGLIVAEAAKKHQASTSDLQGESHGELTATMIARKQSTLEIKEISKIQTEQANFENIMAVAVESCAGLKGGLIPEVVLSIMDGGEITPDNSLQASEVTRRESIEGLTVAVGLRVNGKLLARSKYRNVSMPDMTADITHTFTLRVNEAPSLALDLMVRPAGSATLGFAAPAQTVAQLHVPLPGVNRNDAKITTSVPTYGFVPVVEWVNFASEFESRADSSLFEQLMQLSPVGAPAARVPTSARVEGALLVATEYVIRNDYAVGALKDVLSTDGIDDKLLSHMPASSVKHKGFDSASDFAREKDFQVMIRKDEKFDKHDPRNEEVLMSKRRARIEGTRAERDVFQLGPGPELGDMFGEAGSSYLNYMRLQEPMRHKLLRMRNSKPFLFSQPIPLSDKTIRRSDIYRRILASERLKLKDIDNDFEHDSDDDDDEAMEGVKAANKRAAASFWTRVRESQATLSRTGVKKTFATTSMVAETDITPHLTWMQVLDFSWIIPPRKRALQPTTHQRAPHVVQVAGCNVLVQVVGARNLPVREEPADGGGDAGGGASSLRSGSEDGVKTYVEVKFQDHKLRTQTIGGSAPLWKQSLALPFAAPQMDFTPAALMQVKDEVLFSIFDEYSEDDAGRGGYLEGERTTRSERRFIGSFSVPFSTIYTEGRVEGIFRLNTPKFNFGYMGGTIQKDQNTILAEAITGKSDIESQRPISEGQEGGILASLGLPSITAMSDALLGDPAALMGLRTDPSSLNAVGHNFLFSEDVEKELSSMTSSNQATYIKLMATLDPLLVNHMTIDENASPSSLNKDDRVYSAYARNWLKSLRSYRTYTAKRSYQVFGSNSKGEGVLISRYLTAQQPPLGFTTRRQCIHFVSQIPFIADSHAFVGEKDVWCTTNEVLDLCAGDEEEHGVLLFNYLYYLSVQKGRIDQTASMNQKTTQQQDVFLVIGKAIPEGRTVYVAVKGQPDNPQSTEYLIINPITGYIYSCYDNNCPLTEIAALITPNNIYANIQEDARPKFTDFNIANSYSWRPFFGRRCKIPSGGLQTIQPHVEYKDTPESYALEVEKSMTESVKNAIRRWRSKRQRSTTIFHPDSCNTMHALLEDMDSFMLAGDFRSATGDEALAAIQDRALQKLSSALRMRKLRGFPLNAAFTDMETILDMVKSTGVHETTHPESQFVVAVRIVPYVNNIFACWLYVGTMETADANDIPQVSRDPKFGGNSLQSPKKRNRRGSNF